MYENIPQDGIVSIKLRAEGKEIILHRWEFGKAESNKNIEGPVVQTVLPQWNTDRFELILEVDGNDQFSSRYLLQYKKKAVS